MSKRALKIAVFVCIWSISLGTALIAQTEPFYYVVGEVEKSGPFEIMPGQRVTARQALRQAGIRNTADLSRVSVVRKEKRRVVVNFKQIGTDVELRPGDIVYLPRQK